VVEYEETEMRKEEKNKRMRRLYTHATVREKEEGKEIKKSSVVSLVQTTLQM
jgi:hypothetical protein